MWLSLSKIGFVWRGLRRVGLGRFRKSGAASNASLEAAIPCAVVLVLGDREDTKVLSIGSVQATCPEMGIDRSVCAGSRKLLPALKYIHQISHMGGNDAGRQLLTGKVAFAQARY